MPRTEKTKDGIWYIQAGYCDEAEGTFQPKRQLSGVLVTVKGPGPEPMALLLTVQHGLRQIINEEENRYEGEYWPEYRAWRPGSRIDVPSDALRLRVYAALTPASALPFSDSKDYAFLEFVGAADTAWPGANPDCMESWQKDSARFEIQGYSGGSDVSEFLEQTVSPDRYSGWRFRAIKQQQQIGVLSDGNSLPRGGASGGGVFYKGRLIGCYRGTFMEQQLFLPIRHIQRECQAKGHAVLEFNWTPGFRDRLVTPILEFNREHRTFFPALALGLSVPPFLPESTIYGTPLSLILLVTAFLAVAGGIFLVKRSPKYERLASTALLKTFFKSKQLSSALLVGIPWGCCSAIFSMYILALGSHKVVVELRSSAEKPVQQVEYATEPPHMNIYNNKLYEGRLYFKGERVMMIMDEKLFDSVTVFDKIQLPAQQGPYRCLPADLEAIPRFKSFRLLPLYREK